MTQILPEGKFHVRINKTHVNTAQSKTGKSNRPNRDIRIDKVKSVITIIQTELIRAYVSPKGKFGRP